MAKEVITLGVESSCDESGVAIYSNTRGLLADELFSQIKLHQEYGGVVPEIASRDHLNRIALLTQAALKNAKLSITDINHIAYTQGPGLAGALLVGSAFARSLAFAKNLPITAVNHLEGHLLAPILAGENLIFPFIALLVSGGHTLLVKANKLGYYQILGESVDDAVGEAFDKTAKILGLGYPGGKELSELAKTGDKNKFSFPEPMKHKGLDFSFSGLKTFALNTFIKNPDNKVDIAKAFEVAAINVLTHKTKKALKEHNCKQLIIAGGVSSNSFLRQELQKLDGIKVIMPEPKFCTDNGAMIALAGNLKFCTYNEYSSDLEIKIKPKWPLDELNCEGKNVI
jgi:N6-L-threonylcarbamoyladenine synthase